MSAAIHMRGSAVAPGRKPFMFWVTRDRSAHARLLRGSISLTVPLGRHADVLASNFEDWCFDSLEEGVLAEWKGLELIFHFATLHDAMLFKLCWL